MAKKIRLGDILIEQNLITQEQLVEALAMQKEKGLKLGEILISEGIVSESDLLKVLQVQLGVPYVDLNNFDIDPKVPKMISQSLAREHTIIPVAMDSGRIVVATADPLNFAPIDDVRIITGLDASIVISNKSTIESALNRYYDAQDEVNKAIEEFSQTNTLLNVDLTGATATEEEDVSNSPMVRLVNTIINQAVRRGVSDIHIEPFEDRVRIRYRIDGELIEAMVSTRETHLAIVARIKIIGNMDIAERRRPQDGRLETVIYGKNIDMRISVLPTVYGEKVVIRLLDRDSLLTTIDQLNFTPQNLRIFNQIIKVPEGMILVTGPTGSGKTTTLYTMIRMFNKINKNIITVEDPVEYRIDGINQIQVNDKAGLTFATSLRAILRQDPDIVMVGEIRDSDTASIASRAAITGHVVLSTLHTNDTASTISRLIDMGVEKYMVSSSVVGIIAQRLVKKICTTCRVSHETTEEEMELLGIEEPATVYEGKGCNSCGNTGYKGRTVIHEIMMVNQEIRSLINSGATSDEIKLAARKSEMSTLNDTCKILVLKGTTTIAEMVKVTYSFDA